MNDSSDNPILVALSGGVDSAVSALLLKEQGYTISGVYVRTWEHEDDLLGDCPGARDLKDARSVAELIGIPFSVVRSPLSNLGPQLGPEESDSVFRFPCSVFRFQYRPVGLGTGIGFHF